MPEPFKNLFNLSVIRMLGEHLHRHHPRFSIKGFIVDASHNLPELELLRAAICCQPFKRYRQRPSKTVIADGAGMAGGCWVRALAFAAACWSQFNKKGDTDILQALGYTSGKIVQQKVVLEKFHVSGFSPVIGDNIALQLHICSTHDEPQTLVVDYVVYWRLANGSWSPKVFKWKNLQLLPGQSIELSKKHSFKKITTQCN